MLLDGTTGIDMLAGCVLIFDKSLAFNPRDDMTRTTEKIKRPLSSDGRRSLPTRGSMNLHLQPETDLPRQLCQSGSLAYQVPHLKLSIQSNHVLGLVQFDHWCLSKTIAICASKVGEEGRTINSS
ncbi:hypothetical protein DPMN_189113 [Dreissena polymorpha]|uniref:Uncharacterized protein n=1 Tax=Dreissena polymorpha TaxID=45954 RepID=A0A9D4DRY2_DREPO|nr:hypothetical protein DPMN_189113 [Dreissena polymorpha]